MSEDRRSVVLAGAESELAAESPGGGVPVLGRLR